jgi:hypothetical protein
MPEGSWGDETGEGGPRRYPIQPGQGYFEAGTTGDGRQVLMGLLAPNLVAVFFDGSGVLIGHESRRLAFLQPSGVIVDGEPIEGTLGSCDIFDERIPARITAWQQELPFRPATIRVRRFRLHELGVGIEDHPDHFGWILDDPQSSDEEKDDVRDSMRLWEADGQFVLHWGDDYWLDDTGEVTSS